MLNPADYPEVMLLRKTVIEFQLEFREITEKWSITDEGYITLEMKSPSKIFVVPVMDEYKDFDPSMPSMALNLVMSECVCYEDAEDYLVWAIEMGLNASNEQARASWFQLREVVPKIREYLGNSIEPISFFEYELNAGAAQILREIDNL